MKPQGHVAVSLGLGTIFWARTRELWTVLATLVFGVLIDVDHLFDYFYAERWPQFEVVSFLGSRYWRKSGRVFVLFHGFEYLPLIYIACQAVRGRRWAVVATSAVAAHLLADQAFNQPRPLGYFILYRLAHRFRASEVTDLAARRRKAALRAEHRRLARRGRLPLYQRIFDLLF